jgi:hypothetical protein
MKINFIITNYRCIFEPIFPDTDLNSTAQNVYQEFFESQAQYIINFFQIPLGMISRCEK